MTFTHKNVNITITYIGGIKLYSLNSIKRYLADKFVISCDDNEFDTNALIDGIISNAKLLSNNKLEYDNLLEIFKKRLDVFYNGKNAISKVLNSNGFINHNNDMSILKFINKKRLILAKELIRNGEHLNVVYGLCGFQDNTSFFRAFKKEYNITPRNYYINYTRSLD